MEPALSEHASREQEWLSINRVVIQVRGWVLAFTLIAWRLNAAYWKDIK